MKIKIALAGNPNSGKTTLFNALTGSNQFVGNWPGVTVEKKEGKLKKQEGVTITDLPGIYSLSPYSLEEVVARNYLLNENPDAILNIVDATNLERNLYLTTQLVELGIPVVVALNMMDIVKKNHDKIDVKELEARLGCKVVEISALKGTGVMDAAMEAINVATKQHITPKHEFNKNVEKSLDIITDCTLSTIEDNKKRWYAIKLFERDDKVLESFKLNNEQLKTINKSISDCEDKFEDDSESIITNERYEFIEKLLKNIYHKDKQGELTISDKIDKVVTNRWLALPIFVLVMFVVYFVSVTTIGTWVTDWTNDGLFGDGFHLFNMGKGEYTEKIESFNGASETINGAFEFASNNETIKVSFNEEEINNAKTALEEGNKEELISFADKFTLKLNEANINEFTFITYDEETLAPIDNSATALDVVNSINTLDIDFEFTEPDPASFGVWVPGIPVLVEKGLTAIHTWDWLQALILDGIVAGVGAVLGFVPQILVLFIFLALLEGCGYMSRIAFVLDRIFRKFGLSGKSFIPMLIGTGCGIPGVMASRTIENERDRRMTIMTTTFIPCGAKLPFIAMMAGAIFGGAWWVAPSAYFLGMAAIIVSGIILKKTRPFSGEPAPFVMELPSYHMPTVGSVLRSMWERGWSFIKKAGTIILLSTIVIWFFSSYGFVDGAFTVLEEEQIGNSILAYIGKGFAWFFAPLGFGNWAAAVASITGLVAKENIVATMGIIYGGSGPVYAELAAQFSVVTGYAFLTFNLLCAPCFAAIGAIKREMNNKKWTWFAILYQTGFAYIIALMVNGFGKLFTGSIVTGLDIFAVILSFPILIGMIYLLVRPYKESNKLTEKVLVK